MREPSPVAFRLIRDKQSRRPVVDCLRTLRFDEALSDRVEGARHAVVNGGGCLCEDRPSLRSIGASNDHTDSS